MTLKELDFISNWDVCFTSAYDDKSKIYPLNDILRGIDGVMLLPVYQLDGDPEHCAFVARVPLPGEILNAIAKYSTR